MVAWQVDICRKGTRKAPLSAAQQRRNHRIAKDRVFVEHAFARLAQQGGKSLHTIGLARARVRHRPESGDAPPALESLSQKPPLPDFRYGLI